MKKGQKYRKKEEKFKMEKWKGGIRDWDKEFKMINVVVQENCA